MLDFAALASLAAIYLLGVMSPGPNFVAVTQRAVTRSRAEALCLVAGIVAVGGLWAGAALLGIGAVFQAFPVAFWTVKTGGALYLLWFGWRLLRNAGSRAAGAAPDAPAPRAGLWRAFASGLAVHLSNPKSAVFYASIFSAAVPREAGWPTLAAMLALVLLLGGLWYGGVALVLSMPHLNAAFRRAKAWIDRLCGAALVLFAARLLIDARLPR